MGVLSFIKKVTISDISSDEYGELYVRSQIKKMNPYLIEKEVDGIFELCQKIEYQHPNHAIIIRERTDEIGGDGLARTATLRERQDFRTTCGVIVKLSTMMADERTEYKKSLYMPGDIVAFHPDVPVIFSVHEYYPIHLMSINDFLFKINL